MVSSAQPQNLLEDRRSENDKISRGVWKTVEASARKIRVGKVKKRRSKRRERRKKGREGASEEEEKSEKEEEYVNK